MLKGPHISVRTVREKDLERLWELINDIESQGPFLPGTMRSESSLRKQYAETGLLDEADQRYLIVTQDDEIVGGIWAFKSIPYFDALEVGYQIFDGQHRGKGYAGEALALLVNYLFKTRRINRVELRIAPENLASVKLANRAGFVHEGTHREAAYSQGRLHDIHSYALLRRDWQARDGLPLS